MSENLAESLYNQFKDELGNYSMSQLKKIADFDRDISIGSYYHMIHPLSVQRIRAARCLIKEKEISKEKEDSLKTFAKTGFEGLEKHFEVFGDN